MAASRVPSKKLTFDDAVAIWIRWLTTREFQNRIAADYDTNPGRVNDVLKGRRHPEAKQAALVRLNISNDNIDPKSRDGQLTLI